MNLLFVRHGQSENNAIWADLRSREGRVPDPKLTEAGSRQMIYSARFIESYLAGELPEMTHTASQPSFDRVHLFCSLMERSIQSGEIIAQQLNLPLLGHLEIHENGGLYDHNTDSDELQGMAGLSKREMRRRYPTLILPEEMAPRGWWSRGYENRELSELRAGRVVHELKEKYAASPTCLIFVSHGGFYNTFLHTLLGAKSGECWFELYNGSVSLLEFSQDGGATLLFNNRFDFMPPDLIT